MFTYYKKYNYCEEFIFDDDELKEISEKYKDFLAINQLMMMMILVFFKIF